MHVDTTLEHDIFPVGHAINVHLMVLVKAAAAQDENTRRPLNLSLVIDRSGSMAGAKIDYTRRAAGMLVQNLGMADTLSVVLYNDTVDTLLMPEKVQRKDIINQQIQRIAPSGATNLSGGWLQGCNLVAMNLDSAHTNRVILISDGLANRGVTDTEKLISFARQKYGEGVSTTAMGLGDDFNEELLMGLANAGGGAYYYIDSPEVMPTILNEELTGLLKLVGQNLTISVTGQSASSVRQMNAYPEEPSATGKLFRLGDMFGDEIKALVLELSLPAVYEVGVQQIASLTIEYDQLTDTGASHQVIQRDISVTISGAADKPVRANASVVEQVMLLKAAQARRKAVELADHGKFSEASQVLEAVIVEINESQVGEAPELVEEKKSLARQASDLTNTDDSRAGSGAVPADYVKMRKKMASQAFYTMTNRHNETVILRQRMEAPTEPPKTEFRPLETSMLEQQPPAPASAPKFAQYGEHNYPIEGEEMHFGRAVENDVIINERGVSRYHCVLRKDGDLYWLEDTGSTNGTVVNGITIKSRHSIRSGDVVHLGEAKIRFHDGEAEQQ